MIKRLFMVCGLLLLAACTTHYASTTEVDDQAFLRLTGNFEQALMQVDSQPVIALDSQDVSRYDDHGEQIIKFEIPVGKHEVKVTRNGQLVVHRVMFVTNGNSFEVRIP